MVKNKIVIAILGLQLTILGSVMDVGGAIGTSNSISWLIVAFLGVVVTLGAIVADQE